MRIGNSVIMWSIAGLAASIPIPFINAGQNNIMYNLILVCTLLCAFK